MDRPDPVDTPRELREDDVLDAHLAGRQPKVELDARPLAQWHAQKRNTPRKHPYMTPGCPRDGTPHGNPDWGGGPVFGSPGREDPVQIVAYRMNRYVARDQGNGLKNYRTN